MWNPAQSGLCETPVRSGSATLGTVEDTNRVLRSGRGCNLLFATPRPSRRIPWRRDPDTIVTWQSAGAGRHWRMRTRQLALSLRPPARPAYRQAIPGGWSTLALRTRQPAISQEFTPQRLGRHGGVRNHLGLLRRCQGCCGFDAAVRADAYPLGGPLWLRYNAGS